MPADILVVGARRSNVTPAMWSHPRVAWWQGEVLKRRSLPAAIRALVLTKFAQHSQTVAAMAEARRRGIPIIYAMTTGQLRRVLAERLQEVAA